MKHLVDYFYEQIDGVEYPAEVVLDLAELKHSRKFNQTEETRELGCITYDDLIPNPRDL